LVSTLLNVLAFIARLIATKWLEIAYRDTPYWYCYGAHYSDIRSRRDSADRRPVQRLCPASGTAQKSTRFSSHGYFKALRLFALANKRSAKVD
jgi:hypothetical protein